MSPSVVFPDYCKSINGLAVLIGAYVAFLPYLFEVGDRLNVAPADCFLLLIILISPGRLKYLKPAWSVWHLAIVLIFVASSFVAASRFGELDRYELLNKDAGLLLPLFSYAAITSSIAQWKDLRRILRIFVVSVAAENAVALGGFLTAYFFGIVTPFTRYGLRLSGMLLDPNAYGSLLVVALLICESASWGPRPLFTLSTVWYLRSTLALGILFTFSRSAWVGLGLAILVFIVIKPVIALRSILSSLIIGPFMILLMGSRFLPIFKQMATRPRQVEQRFELIQQGLGTFARHPFIGGGLGSFRLSVGEVAHNSAMWFLADFGIAGLGVYLAFLAWFFRRAWATYRLAPFSEQPVALSFLLAHAAMVGVAMGIEAFYQRHWWLVLAFIGSAYSLVLQKGYDRNHCVRVAQ